MNLCSGDALAADKICGLAAKFAAGAGGLERCTAKIQSRALK